MLPNPLTEQGIPLMLVETAGPVPVTPKPPPWVKEGAAFRAPTGEELRNLPYVKVLLETALKGTNAGDPKKAHEKGGWIYMNLKSGELLHRWAPDGPKGVRRSAGGGTLEFSITIPTPPTMPGFVIVAQFHAHPLTLKELKPLGRWPRGPSDPDDLRLGIRYGVPCFVVDAADIYLYGRVAGRKRLDGNPGYPRDRP
jgi:hypothetical protein